MLTIVLVAVVSSLFTSIYHRACAFRVKRKRDKLERSLIEKLSNLELKVMALLTSEKELLNIAAPVMQDNGYKYQTYSK